jgi:hypothetical protein
LEIRSRDSWEDWNGAVKSIKPLLIDVFGIFLEFGGHKKYPTKSCGK